MRGRRRKKKEENRGRKRKEENEEEEEDSEGDAIRHRVTITNQVTYLLLFFSTFSELVL